MQFVYRDFILFKLLTVYVLLHKPKSKILMLTKRLSQPFQEMKKILYIASDNSPSGEGKTTFIIDSSLLNSASFVV